MSEQRKIENLGKNVKYIRNNICHMTQTAFSEAINISLEQLQKIEQGNSLPSVPKLFAISDYAKIPIDLLAKDDITSAKLFSIVSLMQEIEKHDVALLDNTLDILMSIYEKIRNDNDSDK